MYASELILQNARALRAKCEPRLHVSALALEGCTPTSETNSHGSGE